MTNSNAHYLKRNIPMMFLFGGSLSLMILMPVIVPFFESRGLSMHDIFLLQAFFSGTLLLLEVPSGYVADLLGRRKTLIAGALAWGVGYTIFPFSEDIWLLVVGEVFMALGLSLISGTDVAVIYDSLTAIGSKKAPIKLMGRKLFYQQLGETLGGLFGGWIAIWSIDAVAWGQSIVGWVPLIVAFLIHEPDRPKMDKKKHKENFKYIYRSVFQHSRLLTLIVLNTMFYGVVTLIAVWTFQKYWRDLGVAIGYFGYLWAVSNFTVAVVGRYAHKIEKFFGSEKLLLLLGGLPVLGFLGMAWAPGMLGIAFCLCFQVTRGINAVVLKDALNRRVTGDLRATANSISGLGVRLIFIVAGPLVGFMIDLKGLQEVFIGLAVFYVLVFSFLVLPMLKQKDQFEGGR